MTHPPCRKSELHMSTRVDRPFTTPLPAQTSPRTGASDRVALQGSAGPGLDGYQKVAAPTAALARTAEPKRTVSMVLNPGADMTAVRSFAKKNGLDVAGVDRSTGTVRLSGSNDQLGKAFGVQ